MPGQCPDYTDSAGVVMTEPFKKSMISILGLLGQKKHIRMNTIYILIPYIMMVLTFFSFF